jgi:hypothetical protein
MPWTTSLFPTNDGYVVPLKDLVRNAEGIDVGDTVTATPRRPTPDGRRRA